MDITALAQAVAASAGGDAFAVRLTSSQWQLLGEAMQVLQLRPGETLMRRDEVDDRAFLVESGELQVYVTGGGPGCHRIALLRAGSLVGEPGLFGPTVRLAHVEAVAPCVLWTLRASTLQALAERQPALAAEVLRAAGATMAARMRANLERGIPLT